LGATLQKIIVTDLTRFKNRDLLCMAGVTEDGQTCIRPLRPQLPGYLGYDECKNFNVLPGTILEGIFSPAKNLHAPHIEDTTWSELTKVGICSSDEFENVLKASASVSLAAGFGVPINDKVISIPPVRSIVTLKVRPNQFSISTGYNGDGIKANLTDGAGLSLRFLPITDLGFFDYVGNLATSRMTVSQINSFIATQDRLYLRVGLSRWYESPDKRAGYWLQVNGIYTFPDYQAILRQY
jgi:hypothetical protein